MRGRHGDGRRRLRADAGHRGVHDGRRTKSRRHDMPTDMAGLKNEVIVQKTHRYGYDHALRNCGIRFVEVETWRITKRRSPTAP